MRFPRLWQHRAMPPLTIAFDDPARAAARATWQDDPLVMYLVVRREVALDLAHVLGAAGSLVARAPAAFAADPRFSDDVEAWRAMSFRKVALRANEKDWVRLLEREVTLVAPAAAPLVAVLPPRRRSTVTSFVRNLQAWTADPSELAWEPADADPSVPAVLVAADPSLVLSAGKLVAQVGHACQLVAAATTLVGGAPWEDDVAGWLAAGAPVVAVRASAAGWARALAETECVAVEDGGLTEVAPGTRTVLATRPARGGDRDRLAALLAG
jgi:peptidyl-tRNA hydrolase